MAKQTGADLATFRCTTCGMEKCKEEFHTRKDRPKGCVARCRACANKNERSALRKIQKVSSHLKKTRECATRTCAECGKCKPVEKFGPYCTNCISCNNIRQHTKISSRFCMLAYAAKKRRLSFDLTLEQYTTLIDGALCTYCGFDLPTIGCGLDRVDNDRGYSIDNCVPCCTVCNMARGDNFTANEMRRIGALIREIRLEREANTIGGTDGCDNTKG